MPRPAVPARRRRPRRSRLPIFATAGLLSGTTASFAGHVPIGSFDVVPDAAMSDSQALVGTELGVRTVPFTIEDFTTGHTLLTGTVQQRMIMEAEKQSLSFHYLITGTGAPGADKLLRMSAFSFGEFVQPDVAYLADDAAIGKPSRIGRTDNAVDVAFDESDGALNQGDAISFFVRTNATMYDDTGFVALDAIAPQTDPNVGSPVRTGVAQGLYRAVILETPPQVPLPAAAYTGIIGLSTVLWAKRRMAR
jgi:hypothetical protein